LLGGIADEIEMHQQIRKLAEERLSDWDRNFPSSLKLIGGPRDVAIRLHEMQHEINRLHSIIQDYEIELKEEREKAKNTIDDQLYLSSVGVMREREKMTEDVIKIQRECEERMRLSEERHQESLSIVHRRYEEKIQRIEMTHRVRLLLSDSDSSETLCSALLSPLFLVTIGRA
jgi:hypothetical protein